MSAQTARCLKIAAVFVFGLLCAWAGDTRLALARAQSSQTQSSQAAPSQDASPQQPSTTTSATSAPASADAAEMTTEEASVPLRVLVNLVPVRVIVRDQKGHAVATLHKEDFQLFQDGKLQIISNFSVETPDSTSHPAVPAAAVAPNPAGPAPAAFLPASRFVALLFDDALLNQQDLMQARNATDKYLDSSVTPTDRVAIFTVSGRNQLDFTDDVAKLHKALRTLQVDTITAGISSPTDCPPMQAYEADLIQNHHDQFAIDVATSDALVCSASLTVTSPTGTPTAGDILRAQTLATGMAARVEQETSTQTESTLRRMREVLQRLSAMPGQRNLVMISPGFLYTTHETEYSEIIDRAIRETIFINTLDARGLYVPDIGPDISQSTVDPNPANAGLRSQWNITAQSRQSDSLASFAEDSGGYAFHNNNDLTEGLKEVAGAPEAYYFLAFVPQNFKYDGHYHTLRVTLVPKEKLAVQARRGYYAPLHGESAADVARRDIDDALFSQEEQHGVPVGLQTQYYKNGADAKLSVLAHVDLARVRFTKADGRNQDDLTVVAAIFDRDGNFVTGTQRVISMKLRDETFQRLSHSGVTVRTSFDLKPGDYVVRLVVRDSNAAALSAENGVVEIPY
jgi:VWFA-related protein